MKQFNLEEYLRMKEEGKEPRLVTRNGRSVRIICTDIKDEYPIVFAMLRENGIEYIKTCTTTGTFWRDEQPNKDDLFFADLEQKKKKVPLTYEDLLERVKKGKTMWVKAKFSNILISYFSNDGYICYGDISSSTTDLMNDGSYFADGTPCWKEIEE